jgi:hypothetical protein
MAFIENNTGALAAVFRSTPFFENVSYVEDPPRETRHNRITTLSKTGSYDSDSTITIEEGWGVIPYYDHAVSIDGWLVGGLKQSTSSATEHPKACIAYRNEGNVMLLYPARFERYPQEDPESYMWAATIAVYLTENGTTCITFPWRNSDVNLNGRFTSDAKAVELCTISITRSGEKSVWVQRYYFNNNAYNAVSTASLTNGKETASDIYVCLNRGFSSDEGERMLGRYLTVGYNSLLVKRSQ